MSEEQLERICYLVGHHHTFNCIDGLDYQRLVEADFIVNASESNMSIDSIQNFKDRVFKTSTGKKLLTEIYGFQENREQINEV